MLSLVGILWGFDVRLKPCYHTTTHQTQGLSELPKDLLVSADSLIDIPGTPSFRAPALAMKLNEARAVRTRPQKRLITE